MKTTRFHTMVMAISAAISLNACQSTSSTINPQDQMVIKHTPSTLRSGYITFETDDCRTWVFRDNSEALHSFAKGEKPVKPAKKSIHTPAGVTILQSDNLETLVGYLALKPGFTTRMIGGYLWVFRDTAAEPALVDEGVKLTKSVSKIAEAAGDIRTIKSPDMDTLNAYLAADDE